MKFSVTIPAYKVDYLAEALKSVLQQSYDDFELIIVDDCSPNDIKSVVNQFSDSRIQYYRNTKNCGSKDVVDNWNICLSYCKGDYVLCMGDDDVLLPNCLQDYSDLINEYPGLNVYHAKTQLIDEDSNIVFLQEPRPQRESAYSMLYNLWMYKRFQFIGDFLFSSRWLREQGGYIKFPYAYSSDWVTAFNAALDKGIANGQSFMFQYRISGSTISASGSKDGKIYASNKVRAWYENVLKKEPKDKEDVIYWTLINKMLKKHFYETQCNMMASDLMSYRIWFVWRFFFWLRRLKEFNIPKSFYYKNILKHLPYIILKIPFSER